MMSNPHITLFFLLASFLLYTILGGADFGAGILTLIAPKSLKENLRTHIKTAMGPVWEANHIWLIIIIVMLFVGFPKLYSVLSIYLHIPMMIMLLGIMVRGASFVFIHYDLNKKWQPLYEWVFGLSSLASPFCLGLIFASLFSGTITTTAEGFLDGFIASWLNPHGIWIGGFMTLLSATLATLFLIHDTPEPDLDTWLSHQLKVLSSITVIFGGALLFFLNTPIASLRQFFFSTPIGIASLIVTTLSFWIAIKTPKAWLARIAMGSTVFWILFGFLVAHFPFMMIIESGPVAFHDLLGPDASITVLNGALIIGSCFIFPMLAVLFKVFKKS